MIFQECAAAEIVLGKWQNYIQVLFSFFIRFSSWNYDLRRTAGAAYAFPPTNNATMQLRQKEVGCKENEKITWIVRIMLLYFHFYELSIFNCITTKQISWKQQ